MFESVSEMIMRDLLYGEYLRRNHDINVTFEQWKKKEGYHGTNNTQGK
jgi:hypothetical protein